MSFQKLDNQDVKQSDQPLYSQKEDNLNTRDSNDSTPQMSDSDDNNNEIAVQGFERFRENSTSSAEDATRILTGNKNKHCSTTPPGAIATTSTSTSSSSSSSSTQTPPLSVTAAPTSPPPPNDSIAEYCAESLYSYSFTPLSRVHKAAKIKRQILSRGMDYMQRIRWKTGERDTGRRFSQPDIGVLDQNNDWVETPSETLRFNKYPVIREMDTTAVSSPPSPLATTSMATTAIANGNSAFPPSPLNPSFNDQRHQQQPKPTFKNALNNSIMPSSPTLSSPIPTAARRHPTRSPLASSHTKNDADDADDNDGFHLSRRQTIDVYNNLPPIYESPRDATTTTTTTTATATSTPSGTTEEVFPAFIQYSRALHAPSRFLPQNQAILTTDADATILLFNDMASLCFGIDKFYIGKCILNLLKEPFKKQIGNIIRRRGHPSSPSSSSPSLPISLTSNTKTSNKGHVLVCGVVVPIAKMTGESSAASLWLKEKKTDEGKNIYIWIFEEIYEISLSFRMDNEGIVRDIQGKTKDLFGYESDEILGEPITKLIPALSPYTKSDTPPAADLQRTADSYKFFGGRSKLGICFPLMVNPSASTPHKIKIYSSPSIAGMINVHGSSGKIQSINPVPAKYLFGYAPDALVEKFNIDQLIPQFSDIIAGLRRCHLLQYACTVNNHACRWVISDFYAVDKYKSMAVDKSLKSLERQPSVSANGQTLPIIYAIHRDGSKFDVHLQLRLMKSDQEDIITVWVTFDRIHSVRKAKRAAQLQQQVKQKFQKTTPAPSRPKNWDSATNSTTTPMATLASDQLSHPLSSVNPSAAPRQLPPPIVTTPLSDEPPATPIPTINRVNRFTSSTPHVDSNNKEKDNLSPEKREPVEMPKPESRRRPPVRPYGIASFGAVDQNKALFPEGVQDRKRQESQSLANVSQFMEAGQSASERRSSSLPLQPPTTTPQHPLDAYQIIGTLGEGAYGTAKLAYRIDDPTQTKVVIKCIAKSRIIVDSWIRDRQLGLIPLEIHILKKLKEQPQVNCCALETYMEDEDTYYVVMKLYGVSSMDLFDYIELNENINEDEIRNIFRQVALAVDHIQSLRIVHRDIKDENILLDETGCVHLIDFGSAAYFREGRTFDTFGGTLDYCAPEILKGMPYAGPPQDIWSLGTLLYTLIYRENPFYNVDEILEHDLRIPFILSEGSLELIRKMLNRDVEKRYTIKEVLAHPWLNVCNETNSSNNASLTNGNTVNNTNQNHENKV